MLHKNFVCGRYFCDKWFAFFLRVSFLIAKTLDGSMFKMKVGSPKEIIKNKNQYFQLLLDWARTLGWGTSIFGAWLGEQVKLLLDRDKVNFWMTVESYPNKFTIFINLLASSQLLFSTTFWHKKRRHNLYF